MVESRQLVAQSLTLDLTADSVNAGRTEHLHQQHAQPVAHLRQCQGRRQLLPPVGFIDQALYWIPGSSRRVKKLMRCRARSILEAPEPFATLYWTFTLCVLADHRKEQHVALPLMIPLVVK